MDESGNMAKSETKEKVFLNKRNIIIVASAFLVFIVCIAISVGYAGYIYLNSPISSSNSKKKVIISIPKGTSFQQTLKILSKNNLLDRPILFKVFAHIRGDYSKIKAGEYEVSPQWTPTQMLNFLIAGRSRLYKITIPEGLTYVEIVTRIADMKLGSLDRFLKLKNDPALLKKVPFTEPVTSLEGFLFPETYFFSRLHKEEEILEIMIIQFSKHYTQEYKDRAKEFGLSDYEVLVLASIIEKETGRTEERPLISAVFHNRLKRKMRLESDPTVIYGIENFDGNLKRKHLETPTPYNSYTNFGLMPTPICNPGKESIKSTLYPAKVKYLYFVAKGDGSSYFSSTLKEHNRAVWRYQKRRRSRKKSK